MHGRDQRATRASVRDGSPPGWRYLQNQKGWRAQREAFDRILTNHVLYCTVCDNNNGNCTVHNTEDCWASNISRFHFIPSLTKRMHSNPFYRYDPQQCILCGRCVEACQNVQVNETLSINWRILIPRALGWRLTIGESSCVFLRPLHHGVPV